MPRATAPAAARNGARRLSRRPARPAAAAMPRATPRPAKTPIQYQLPLGASVVTAFRARARGYHSTAMNGRSGGSGRDSRTLLVFFSALRSGHARRMDSLLAQLARKERDRLSVAQVDVDE